MVNTDAPRPALLQDLPDEFADLRPILEANLEPYIAIAATQVTPPTRHPADPLTRWQSKLGGDPYFPTQATYPTDPNTGLPMALLVQINCADVPPIAGFDFPAEGMWQLYVGGGELARSYRDGVFQVIYFPTVTDDPANLIADFSFVPRRETYRDQFDAVSSLTFTVRQDLFLDLNSPNLEDFDPDVVADFEDWLYDYVIETEASGLGSKLGGWPDPHGSAPDFLYRSNGRLLLELAGIQGSSESVYCFIDDDSLKARDFSAVRFFHDCD